MGNSENQAKGKRDVILKVVGSLLAAATVAIIGLAGRHYLEKRQQIELRMQLYTELMSRREQAESALRKDMFRSIIDTFLKPAGEVDVTLEEKVLNLELLAYNFHESLNLKPLFFHLERLMDRHGDSLTSDPLELEDCHKRLRRVAREITGKQILTLKAVGGQSWDEEISFRDSFRSPFHDGTGTFDSSILLDDHWLVLDSIKRHFSVEVLDVDKNKEEIKIQVEAWMDEDEEGGEEPYFGCFGVGPYDFPMIDNSRLSKDQRFAVVTDEFTDSSVIITLVYFRGQHASLKERPYVDNIVDRLLPKTGEAE
jgi:hypothetical protein